MLRVWGGRIQLPAPDLGGGCTGARQDGGSGNPEPGLDEGPFFLSVSIWGEGTLQRLPSTARPSEERFTNEPFPVPSVRWGGRGVGSRRG